MTTPTKDKIQSLPKLRPDVLLRVPLLCRLGWHSWAWLKEFGRFGHSQFQRRECTRCGKEQWKDIGWDAGKYGQ